MTKPTAIQALKAHRIYDGATWHTGSVLLIKDGVCAGITQDIPKDATVTDTGAEMLVPGFIDLQVNGGAGVQFNDAPTAKSIRQIISGHARFGTTALLPTLITDTPEATHAALSAAKEVVGEPGFIGLHLEGPHLDPNRKGAHHEALIRPMEQSDLDILVEAKQHIPVLIVTVAPENVALAQIKALDAAGVIVSLGHSNCSYETAQQTAQSGARMVTHLFNAMSPLTHRAPGLVGAALDTAGLSAGIIADGIHVLPPAIRIALRTKAGPAGRLFLVTDAMAPIGTDMTEFTLNGRKILRRNGCLTLEDGTLAGADIDMAASIRFMVDKVGVALDTALNMASKAPAEVIGLADRKGALDVGKDADIVALNSDLQVVGTWIGGESVYQGG